jgi:hypothetical protein
MKKLMFLTAFIAITTIANCQTKLPEFFKDLTKNYIHYFSAEHSYKYLKFCKDYNIDDSDTNNFKKFYTILILHKLFTNRKYELRNMINIPYIYNWITPNPRYKIKLNNKYLKNIAPPKGFEKYKSYAEIDRTPYIFIKDMFSTPKYSLHKDTFATFGWCSEREMAFISILKCMGFEQSKVSAIYGHAVSYCIVTMKNKNNEMVSIEMNIDNTFNTINYWKFEEDINQWKKDFGTYKLGYWYNKMVVKDLFRVKKIIVSNESKKRIYKEINNFME